jgi:hypothetical protein
MKPHQIAPNFQVNDKTVKELRQSDCDVESSVCTPVCTETAKADPDLARLIDAWPSLPDPIRRAMLALVASTDPAAKSSRP